MAKPDHNIFPHTMSDDADWAGKKVGLLGGSFNPAHDAHLEISLVALDRLGLDAIWWLVSPQNPLKSPDDMAALTDRMASARSKALDTRIFVTDLEEKIGTTYTAETLQEIKKRLPDVHFIWLMGADNLQQFSRWKDWKEIGHTLPFAIFDRPGYSNTHKTSEAADYFRDHQIPPEQAAQLALMKTPAWTFIRDTQNPLSSTEIRRKNLYKPRGYQ